MAERDLVAVNEKVQLKALKSFYDRWSSYDQGMIELFNLKANCIGSESGKRLEIDCSEWLLIYPFNEYNLGPGFLLF